MKRILISLALVLGLATSCDIQPGKAGVLQIHDENVTKLTISSEHSNGYSDRFLIPIHHEGHNYIVVYVEGGGVEAIIHNPDCPCHNKVQEKQPSYSSESFLSEDNTNKLSW